MSIQSRLAARAQDFLKLCHESQGVSSTYAVKSGNGRFLSVLVPILDPQLQQCSRDKALTSLLDLNGNTEGTPPLVRKSQCYSKDKVEIAILYLIAKSQGTTLLMETLRQAAAKSPNGSPLMDIIGQALAILLKKNDPSSTLSPPRLPKPPDPSRTREQSDFCSSISAVQRLSPLSLMSRRKKVRLISLPAA